MTASLSYPGVYIEETPNDLRAAQGTRVLLPQAWIALACAFSRTFDY
jgi:hypothetical protein